MDADATARPAGCLCPETVAASYAAAVAARWRGDADGEAFDAWLEAFWNPEPMAEPTDPPAAVSELGGMPAVRWYRLDDAVVGFATGRRGCWWIPAARSPMAA